MRCYSSSQGSKKAGHDLVLRPGSFDHPAINTQMLWEQFQKNPCDRDEVHPFFSMSLSQLVAPPAASVLLSRLPDFCPRNDAKSDTSPATSGGSRFFVKIREIPLVLRVNLLRSKDVEKRSSPRSVSS